MHRRAWIALCLGVVLTVLNLIPVIHSLFPASWKQSSFYDFRLWRRAIELYQESGVLYDTRSPHYYDPGSHCTYKYPPVFAALLLPFHGRPQGEVVPVFFAGNLVLLVLSVALVAAALRPRWQRTAWMALVAANWQPVWETFGDLQMEILLLALLSGAVLGLRRASPAAAGAALGAAAAIKVYPALLALLFVIHRRWRLVLGAGAGFAGVLLLTLLAFPFATTWRFFTQILPRLGGTSLSHENVSLLGFFGRGVLLMATGLNDPAVLDPMVLERVKPSWIPALAYGLALATFAGVTWLFLRRLSRMAVQDPTDRAAILLGGAVVLLLLLIPSTWFSYQALLVLPAMIIVARLGAEGQRVRRSLLVLAFAPALLLNGYGPAYSAMPGLFSLLRSAFSVPLLLLLTAGKRSE